MGVWGFGPFDNDTAGDVVGKMMEPIRRVLDLPLCVPRKSRGRGKRFRYIASDYYLAARASAALIVFAHGTDILGGPNLHPVLEALKKMRSDKEWLAGYKDRGIQRAIDLQIRSVQRKIRLSSNRKRRVKTSRRPGRVLCRKK